MLLRSSSTPLLDSLLPPSVSCLSEPLTEHIKKEGPAAEAMYLPKSLTFTTRGSPSCLHTNCLSNLDPHSQAVNGSCAPFSRVRKVLSENDLCILAMSVSSHVSPAQVAANSLLHDDNAECSERSDLNLGVLRSHLPNVKNGRTALPLCQWRSLGSELPSVFLDGDSTILEEVESASSYSSTVCEDGDDKGRRTCVFDKLAFLVEGNALDANAKRVMQAIDVGSAWEAKEHQVLDAADVDFRCSTLDDGGLLNSTSDKQGEGGWKGDSEMSNLSKHRVDASASGWEEPSYMVCQGTSCFLEGREGSTGSAVLVPHTHGRASQSRSAYQGDPWELAPLSAGDGGRGSKPPTGTGGRGGSGEHGGRNCDPTEFRYQSMLKDDPGNALILQNYAQYLTEVKRDYQKAEEFFQRAILANPSDGELLGQYAKMLWEVQQDRKRAATYFERAVQAAPDNSYVMAAYASFLWSAEEEEEGTVGEVNGSSPANVPTSHFSMVSAGLA